NSLSTYPAQDDPQRIYVSFRVKPNITYTVTLKAGIQDQFGGVLPSDYTYSFYAVSAPTPTPTPAAPAPPPPAVIPMINSDMMIFPTYHGIPRIPVQVRGSETTNFALYRWQPTNLGDIPFMNHQFLQMGSNNVRLFEELRGNCKAHPAIQEANLVRR